MIYKLNFQSFEDCIKICNILFEYDLQGFRGNDVISHISTSLCLKVQMHTYVILYVIVTVYFVGMHYGNIRYTKA
jgi:hypothetical protein